MWCCRSHLEESVELKEKDMQRVSFALNAYATVGSGFEALVEEYGKLKAELDNKQWALNEFRKTEPK